MKIFLILFTLIYSINILYSQTNTFLLNGKWIGEDNNNDTIEIDFTYSDYFVFKYRGYEGIASGCDTHLENKYLCNMQIKNSTDKWDSYARIILDDESTLRFSVTPVNEKKQNENPVIIKPLILRRKE